MKSLLYIFLFVLLFPLLAVAQEENATYMQGTRYVALKVNKLEKYNGQLKNRQEHLLKKLKKKETRFLSKVKRQDSTAYEQLASQSLSFDSLSKLERPDSATLARKNKGGNKAVDSLRVIQAFISKQSTGLGLGAPTANNTNELNSLQNELNYRKYIDNLIGQRTKSIKGIATTNKISGFTSLEKKAFYAKQKMQALKDISEEPSKAEEKALEYLQGAEGYDSYMDKVGAGTPGMKALSGSTSSSDLEKMGVQTKQQLQNSLKGKFGNDLGGVTQKMGSQVKEFTDKGKDFQNTAKEGKATIKDIKKTGQNVQSIEKPSFRVNPMRGKLFWQRIEKQYTWQTARATTERPAQLEGSVMAGFKQTPKLAYGLGIATTIGLGQGWNKIKISFEGIGLRSFAKWEWQYGIGAYAGYEHMLKSASFTHDKTSSEVLLSSPHNTDSYLESALIGITKSYNVNTKYNGALQVLYDIWWKEKGLRSPIVLRISTQSK